MRYRFLIPLLFMAHVAHAGGSPRSYVVSTIAGVPGVAGYADGRTDTATFNKPTWLDVVVDSDSGRDYYVEVGSIFVVDRVNQSVRRIARGNVTTYRTDQGWSPQYSSYSFDFGGPFGGGLMVEPKFSGCGAGEYAGGFFVASTGRHEIPLMSFTGSLASRDCHVILGSSTPICFDLAKVAPFARPIGIALSPNYGRDLSRELYLGDAGRHTIHRITWGYSMEACPIPAGTSIVAGLADSAGSEDGPRAGARFNTPLGIATGPDGSLYVADSGNHTIRRIAPDGQVSTIAGRAGVAGAADGPAGQSLLNTPADVDVAPGGEIFVTDTGNHTIRRIGTDGVMTTVAGLPGIAGHADGAGPQARFSGPVGIRALADGSIVVADTSNHVIRQLVPVPPRRRAVR